MSEDQVQIKVAKKSFSLKRFIIVVMIVIVTAAVGLSVWWRYKKVIDEQNSQIDFLESQADTLSEKLKSYPD